MPGESRGLLRKVENWSGISMASISMGQEVGVTPIQLITAVSAIANGGTLYRPHVVANCDAGRCPCRQPGLWRRPSRGAVIRPETAATLAPADGRRGLLTARAPARGWMAGLRGGKPVRRRKSIPTTGRYSPTQLIASFTGFAPINDPAVTILVSLDSPVGLHEGGLVAAPVFKRIAEQVLPYLEVPRDVPLNPRLIKPPTNTRTPRTRASLEDFMAADFSAQPEDVPRMRAPMKAAKPKPRAAEVMMGADEGGDITVPDFAGKTMREVTEMCLRLGLDPVLVGSNLATEQTPAVGANVKRGARITVQFGTPAAKPANSAKPHKSSKR